MILTCDHSLFSLDVISLVTFFLTVLGYFAVFSLCIDLVVLVVSVLKPINHNCTPEYAHTHTHLPSYGNKLNLYHIKKSFWK